MPYDRTRELMSDLCQAEPALGTLDTTLAICHRALAPVAAQIREGLVLSAVAQFDETGIRIGGPTHWLPQAGTPSLTFYAHHRKRGRVALDAVSPIAQYKGIAVAAALRSYLGYPCEHALGNAHRLRELTALSEQGNDWACQLHKRLLDITQAVDTAKPQALTRLPDAHCQTCETDYRQLVPSAWQANPPTPPTGQRGRTKQSAASHRWQRLTPQREAVLRFTHHLAVPFDHHLAERDLRMVKLRQKISGCFRSNDGASMFCRIRGYLSTLRKQRLPVLPALHSAIMGRPFVPQLR